MKNILVLTLVVLALLFALASCGGQEQSTTTQQIVTEPPTHIHTPGAWVTIKEPSCKDGEQCQFCASCGEILQTLPIAATGVHKEVIEPSVEATCTSTGLTEGRHCATCGKIFVAQTETPKLPHLYDNDKDETCNNCDFIRDVTCKHTDVTLLPAKDPNCTESGVTEGKVCNGCQAILLEQQIIDALKHIEVIDKGYAATCTTAGLREGKHCERCSAVLVEQSVIKAFGHNESAWIIEKEPTENEDGYKYKKCNTCGEKVAEEIIPCSSDIGLDYTVNSDGKTCTITGIGTFGGTVLNIPDYIRTYKVTSIGDRAFSECTQLTEISLPETVTTIGTRAFYGCMGITEITIPASVTSIGTQVFYKASNLNTVYYNGSYSSTDNKFLNLDHITKVVFGGSSIPKNILEEHTNITEVEIKESVKSIYGYAFYNCTSLTSIEIGDSVTSIGNSVFRDCTSLTSIEIPDSVTSIDYCAFSDCTSLTNIKIPDSVTSIDGYAFYGCTSLTSIEIPNSVISIGNYAFYNSTSLTSIEIGDTVTSIGDRAFSDCTSLTKVVIGISETSFDEYVFYGCMSLTSIEVDTNNQRYKSIDGNLYSKDGKTLVQYAIGKEETSFTIPDSVTNIGDYAFASCTSLTSIEIPDSVISVGESVFNGCTSIKSVVIGDSVTSIGDSVFFGCTSLVSIEIPDSVTSIDGYAFYGCTSLTSIEIGDTVTSIGNYAFYGCTSITSIEIPDYSVTSIGGGAFENCTSLKRIVIPNSVTKIGAYAFRGCKSLIIYCKTISMPAGWDSRWNYTNCTVVWGYNPNQNNEE